MYNLYICFKHFSVHMYVCMLYFTIRTSFKRPKKQFWVTPNLRQGLQEKGSGKQTGQVANQERKSSWIYRQEWIISPTLSCSCSAGHIVAGLTATSLCPYSRDRNMLAQENNEQRHGWEEILLGGRHVGKCLPFLNEQRYTKF